MKKVGMLLIGTVLLSAAACSDYDADASLNVPPVQKIGAADAAVAEAGKQFSSEAEAARAEHYWLDENLREFTRVPADTFEGQAPSGTR